MGLLLVDKPAGRTSHDVIQEARRRLDIRRIGHTGTLDPFATGLLLLLVGRLTRVMEHFHLLRKTYEATMRLGLETDTEDLTGSVVAESDAWRGLGEDRVTEVLGGLRGRTMQVPSVYSARAVGGERAYAAAREGRPIALEARPIDVHEIEIARFAPPLVHFSVTVSTGTYVRALARDAGRELGCGAHLVALRRTAIGPFSVEDAAALDGLPRELPGPPPSWLEPAEALGWLWRRDVTAAEGEAVRHGRPIPLGTLKAPAVPDHGPSEPDAVTLFEEGRLLGLGEARDDRVHPRKVLAA